MNETALNRHPIAWEKPVYKAAWFLAWFVVFATTLHHFYPTVSVTQDRVFGADTTETLKLLGKLDLNKRDARKHPMFSLALRPPIYVLKGLGAGRAAAIQLVLAVMAALNMLVMLVLLRRFFVDIPMALAIGAFYGLCFANLVVFSIPETYVLSLLFVLVYMYLFLVFKDRLSRPKAITLGVVAGLAGLCNLPLLSLGLIPAVHGVVTREFRETLIHGVLTLGASVAVITGVLMGLYGTTFFMFYPQYADKWASLRNFLDPVHFINVPLNLFVYSIIAPGTHVKAAYVIGDAADYLTSIKGVLLLIGYLTGLYYVTRHVIVSKGSVEIGIVTWLVVVVAFYIYFNPKEAILYSVQILPFICMLLAAALAQMTSRRGHATVLTFLVLMGFHNLSIVFAAIS